MNSKERERVRALERRRDHLVERLENWNVSADKHRTRAELGALNWALRVIAGADAEGVLQQLEDAWGATQ